MWINYVDMYTNGMSTLLILTGLPGSGKTHFAEQFGKKHGFLHINNDQMRFKLIDDPKFTPEERIEFYNKLNTHVIEQIKKGTDLLYDGNLLTNKERVEALKEFSTAGARVVFVYFDTLSEFALERALSRTKSDDKLYKPMVPERAKTLHNKFETLDPSLPQVTIKGTDEFSVQDESVLQAISN